MTDLEEIEVTHREGGTEEPVHPVREGPPMRSGKNANGRERENSNDVDDSGDGSSPGQNQGDLKADKNRELKGQMVVPKGQDVGPPREALRAKFYERYRKEGEEYDKEFMKKYEEDLDTTLIFAGLFSAVTSAFTIEVNSQFQPDPNQETAALLRVLIYKVDNTTFGDTIPAIPQPWIGPPRMIVQVQALLFASLTASLFSAFLVILGKQWLNRYASIDMRGSAIERSRNRQRKLDGIVNWYFDNVMESLPLMLQAALLLLGCALSRHLWEINMTVALVVLGVTSFDVLFYLFIVIAGAVFASCPYQTPGAHILRHILDALRLIFRHIPYFPHRIRDTFHRIRYVPRHIPYVLRRIQDKFHHILHDLSVLYSVLVGNSITYPTLVKVWGRLKEAQCSSEIALLLLFILLLPIWLILDVCRAIVWSLVISFRWVDHQVQKESERRAAVLDQQTAVLDQHCISWTLRTSLDGPVRLSALDYLATTVSAGFDPTLVAGCFDVLFGCIKLAHYEVVVTQGSEQLAAASALCCLHILPHLMAKDPTPRVLEDIHQRYTKAFPLRAELDLPAPHTLDILRQTFYSWISWNNRRQI